MLPESIQKLIDQFNKLPGIGQKTSERFILYLLKQPKSELENMAENILNLKNGVVRCKTCFNFTEKDPCQICSDPSRTQTTICVVADSPDLMAIERAREYQGVYHILGGTINHIEGIGPEQLSIKPLITRIRQNKTQEVIIATNPDIEGESTAMYLFKLLKPLNIKITRIGRGLPMGANLEYADEVTLQNAMQSRREM